MDRGTVEVEREREDDREREREVSDRDESRGRLAGLRSRLPSPSLSRPRPLSRLGGSLSLRAFALALAVGVAAMVAGTVVPLPGARFLLLFAGTFGYGALAARSRYVECAVAGALAAGLGFVLSVVLGGALLPVLAGYGAELAGVGVTAGALVALAGHYFGRDLRGGLTRDL
jgi:hypothetical protein